ncbi:MAG: chromosome segregation protein SMC [Caldicoprobacterales bacterium]
MILKKLEMYGFKSFADRIEIEFDKGITAIVGPNGSGKSNVADAIRWVLGEQSAKSLRGSRMEDIIFSGTQKRNPLGFAEVSLTFDNSDHVLPVDFSEVTITRRLFRSGESEYYINRSSCRLKDIVELFMDTGVGKEGYSIIGQGRIEEILSTQPENRRLVFEEAAGIVKYKTRKQESERKLEVTQENIVRVEDILREIENQLGPLEVQSRVAKEYLSLRDRLKFYDLNKFIVEYDSHKQKIDQIKENLALLEQDIKNHRQSIVEQETRGNELNDQLIQLDNKIQSLRDTKYGILNEIEKLKGAIQVIEERIIQLDKEKIRLEEELKGERESIVHKDKEKNNIIYKLKEKKQFLNTSLSKSAELEIRLEEINKELSARQQEAQKKKNRMMEIWKSLSEAKNNITRFQTLKSNLEEQMQRSIEQLTHLKQSRVTIINEYKTIKKSIKKISEKIIEKNEEKAILGQKLNTLEQNLKDMDNKLQQQNQQLEGSKSRLNLLVEMSNAYEGYQKSVKNILLACRNNPSIRERVCGVVAELIDVPKKYEIAIETALGSSLQHIVTYDEEDAKYIIEFLRQRRLGRATFLPISSIRSRDLYHQEKAVLDMEGCLGRGVDLIKFEDKYKDIFSNLLGRVIITENLDQAIEIARKFSYSFRIVTLEGDVVNTGGSMTGGSLNKRSTGIIGRSREIDELKVRIEQLSMDMENLVTKKEALMSEYTKTKDLRKKLTHEIHELEIEIAAQREHLEGISNQVEKGEEEVLSLEQNKTKLEQDIVSMDQSIKVQESIIAELETQNKDAQTLAEDTDSSIESISRQRAGIDQEITSIKIEIAGLKHEIGSLEEKLHQLDRDIESHQKNIENKTAQLRENSRRIEKYKEEIIEHKNKIKDFEVQVEDIEISLNQKLSHKDKLSQQITSIDKRIKELTAIIEEVRVKKHNMDVQLSRVEMEIENAQNRIWEEYEISYAHALKYRDESLTVSQIRKEIQQIKQRISELGNININSIEEYKQVKERYDFLTKQKADLVKAKENLQGIIKDVTATMEKKFAEEFAVINKHFGRVFSQLFGGGKAELILEDPDNVLTSGIEIVAQPPGKKLQSISLLSGGEKALTAISILFAILEHKPTPFCVLDEIEAALDENNVQSFGKYLRKFSEETQFVIITHRRGTMENSDVLYGVAMEEKGVSRMISVKLEDDIAS